MRDRCRCLVVTTLLVSCSSQPGASDPVQDVASEAGRSWEICTRTAVSMGVIPDVADAAARFMGVSPGGLLVSVNDGMRGRELWLSSGSRGAGTRLLKDIFPGPGGSDPEGFTRVGDQVYFVAHDGEEGHELYVSDGTLGGTRQVKDIWRGDTGSFPQSMFEYKDLLYLAAGDVEHGREPWRSDGTSAGTFLVEDLDPGVEGSSPHQFTQGGDGALYFIAGLRSTFTLLLRSNGGPGAVELFRTPNDQGIEGLLTPVGRKLFFVEGAEHGFAHQTHVGPMTLMVTEDGAPPVMVRHFGEVTEMAALGSKLLLGASADVGSTDLELWVSDGTMAGTTRLKDLWPGSLGSSPNNFVVLEDRLFFAADDGIHGMELWVSDGTAAGTHLFADLELGAGGSFPEDLTVVENNLFFGATTGARGAEPWVSNGLRGGTVALTEIAPGARSSSPQTFLRSGWDVFFTAEDAGGARRLYALPFRPVGSCAPEDR